MPMHVVAIPGSDAASYNDFKRYKKHLFHVIKKIAEAKNIKICGYEKIDSNPEFLNNLEKAIKNGAYIKIIYAEKDLNEDIIKLSKKYPKNIEIRSAPGGIYEKNKIKKFLMKHLPQLCMCNYKVIDDLITNANPVYKTKAKSFPEVIYTEVSSGLSYPHREFLSIIHDRFDRDWNKAQKANLN